MQFESHGVIVDLLNLRIDRRAVFVFTFDEHISRSVIDVLVEYHTVGEYEIVCVERFAVGPADTATQIERPGSRIGRRFPLCAETGIEVWRVAAIPIIDRTAE